MFIQAVHSHCWLVLGDIYPPYVASLISTDEFPDRRSPPTSCHHKQRYNEHLQTSPLIGLCEILLGNTHRVHFDLTKLYQVALQKGASGHAPNSRAWIHSKPLALCSFLTLNPGLLSHSTISTILLLSAFISHPPLNCNYHSFVFL